MTDRSGHQVDPHESTPADPDDLPPAIVELLASTVPDPVSDPAGYQRHLVQLVGDEEPGAVQARAVAGWRRIIDEAGERLRTKPAPGEWSALECLGHATDAEVVMTGRYRWALAEDEPEIVGYDQDRWVAALRHGRDDPEALLGLFGALRAANLALWAETTEAERDRVVRHRERGPESLRLMFTMLAGHDRFHLAQARRALAAAIR